MATKIIDTEVVVPETEVEAKVEAKIEVKSEPKEMSELEKLEATIVSMGADKVAQFAKLIEALKAAK